MREYLFSSRVTPFERTSLPSEGSNKVGYQENRRIVKNQRFLCPCHVKQVPETENKQPSDI